MSCWSSEKNGIPGGTEDSQGPAVSASSSTTAPPPPPGLSDESLSRDQSSLADSQNSLTRGKGFPEKSTAASSSKASTSTTNSIIDSSNILVTSPGAGWGGAAGGDESARMMMLLAQKHGKMRATFQQKFERHWASYYEPEHQPKDDGKISEKHSAKLYDDGRRLFDKLKKQGYTPKPKRSFGRRRFKPALLRRRVGAPVSSVCSFFLDDFHAGAVV